MNMKSKLSLSRHICEFLYEVDGTVYTWHAVCVSHLCMCTPGMQRVFPSSVYTWHAACVSQLLIHLSCSVCRPATYTPLMQCVFPSSEYTWHTVCVSQLRIHLTFSVCFPAQCVYTPPYTPGIQCVFSSSIYTWCSVCRSAPYAPWRGQIFE